MFRDIKEMLGISTIMLDKIIDLMLEESMLEYKNNMLTLGEKGIRMLISANMYNNSNKNNIFENTYEKKDKWDIYRPYVPIKF
ncbi:MAG: hypothetical protein K0S41_1250 [Anaerocolumna sp.]|nr:hypothetical protein [Anaerocolumna sp.]